jgi:Leucine-rich repeat (LRR) protein
MNSQDASQIKNLYTWAKINNISLLDQVEIDNSTNPIGLPKDESTLLNSTKLYLDNCNFKRLPKEISLLKRLIRLDISCNNLSKLPHEIEYLTNLICLNLSDNQLNTLPDGITKLLNLESLDLSGNLKLNLTEDQKRWIEMLKIKGCLVDID